MTRVLYVLWLILGIWNIAWWDKTKHTRVHYLILWTAFMIYIVKDF